VESLVENVQKKQRAWASRPNIREACSIYMTHCYGQRSEKAYESFGLVVAVHHIPRVLVLECRHGHQPTLKTLSTVERQRISILHVDIS
jgi:hypothetical protein